ILIGPGSTVGTVAISPDGKIVAYLARVNGKPGLWIRPLDASAATQLPGTEGAAYPMWAPDGRSLAFFVRNKLQRSERGSSKPGTLASAAGSSFPGGSLLRNGSWGSDGSILFPVTAFGLLRVSATGGTPTAVTRVDAGRGEVSHGDPQFLPRGRVLFSIAGNAPDGSGTYAA